MKTRKKLLRLAALLLPVLLLFTAAQTQAVAKSPAALRIAVLSDTHVYPAAMTNKYCPAFVEEETHNGRAIEFTQGRFEAAMADMTARAKREKLEFLLVAGDMSEWGEYAGHALVAKRLRQFERETGVQVAAIPGNHDIDNSDACDFSTGKKEKARYLKRGEFPEMYAQLGYDLPNCERYENGLSYAVDLGKHYRLVVADTDRWLLEGDERRCTTDELRDWVLGQCKKARAAGKTIIGMGHHPLGEQIGNQDTFMGDHFGFGDPIAAAEAFADAGMHFYFSGHLHFNEIAMRVSDSGEPLYDIMTAAAGFFPGGYRTVKFSASGKKTTADVRSVAMPLTRPSPYPDDPYYDTFYGRCFGSPHGDGLAGWLKYAVEFALGPTLRDMSLGLPYVDERLFGQPERLLEVIYGLVDEIVAMPVSQLPCTYLRKDFGFGDPDRPGNFEDMGNCALVYLFGKRGDADKDAFFQDVLRRMKNGEFVDQLLEFAVPKIFEALGGGVLPLLVDGPITVKTMEALASGLDCPPAYKPLLALAAGPGVRKALSESLYHFASGVVTVQSPTGSPDGVLAYDGPVKAPTDPGAYRLPQDISACAGLTCAEITWLTRRSAKTPELKVTCKDGNPAPEVKVSIESAEE
ncbi:MAG: metallophosphoesterase, partial [Oscillospiraceae bacterium]|nr:metallophosphoesterase [Oscillospiraceae bacterium]